MPFRGLRLITYLWGILITSLVPQAAHAAVVVTLLWTSPGDDGNTGIATTYDLRYSLQPITATNFAAATPFVGEPTPLIAGTAQTTTVAGLTPNTTYYFAIKTADERGNWSPISNVAVATGGLVGINSEPGPLVFSSPWPNPSRASTRFSVSLPRAGAVRIEAFDLSGRRVRTLLEGEQPSGSSDLIWDLNDDQGRALGAGVYLIRAQLPGQVITRRALIVR